MNNLSELIPIISVVLTGIGTLVMWVLNRGKRRVDVTEQLTSVAVDAAVALVDPLENRIVKLEQSNETLRGRVETLEDERLRLSRRVRILEFDNEALRGRVKALEEENTQLKQQVRHLEQENEKLSKTNKELREKLQG